MGARRQTAPPRSGHCRPDIPDQTHRSRSVHRRQHDGGAAVTRHQLNAARRFDAAEYLLKLNLQLVPVAAESKNPIDKKWEQNTYTAKDFVDDGNIGIKTGQEVSKNAYFVDIDIDLKLDDGSTIFPGASDVVAE